MGALALMLTALGCGPDTKVEWVDGYSVLSGFMEDRCIDYEIIPLDSFALKGERFQVRLYDRTELPRKPIKEYSCSSYIVTRDRWRRR